MKDPIILASEALRSTISAPIKADRVGHQVGDSLVLVALSGMERVVQHRLEVADYTAHCYGPSKQEALSLAMRVRAAVLNVDLHASSGVVITDSVASGPNDLPDEDSGEQRFIVDFSFFYYETGG
ncbi:hypothetical protein AB0I72_26740 [Nocardiopsis sp. NPDC049922]|uniref:hypothetical protein n=1 Tax=Nocardiopsis sp. NPDC049922 TaxID=3155157 RepID=UPI003404F2FA